MKNDSYADMAQELKSSPIKLFFVALLVVGGLAGLWLEFFPPAKQISASYDEIMEEVYLSNLTTAQEQSKKSQYTGKHVSWRGRVADVKKQGFGFVISVGDNSSASTDIFLTGISKADALRFSVDDDIRFTGRITKFLDGFITGYVYLDDVILN